MKKLNYFFIYCLYPLFGRNVTSKLTICKFSTAFSIGTFCKTISLWLSESNNRFYYRFTYPVTFIDLLIVSEDWVVLNFNLDTVSSSLYLLFSFFRIINMNFLDITLIYSRRKASSIIFLLTV